MALFSRDIYPRVTALTASYDADVMRKTRNALPDKEDVDLGTIGAEFAC